MSGSHRIGPSSGSSGITFTDGTHTVSGATHLLFSGATVSGATPNATATITASGGGPAFHPGFISGRWYSAMTYTGQSSGAMSANTLYAHPFYVGTATVFTKIGVNVTSGALGKSIELGIYALTGNPLALEYDCGTVSGASNGAQELTGLTLSLTAGWHALAAGSDGTPSVTMLSGALFGMIGEDTLNGSGGQGYFGSWTFSAGALPGTFPTVTNSNSVVPMIWLSL